MSEGKDRLKQLRNALGISQNTLDEIMCFKTYTTNSIEGGKQKLSVKVALALKEKIVQSPDGRLRIVTPDSPRKEVEAQLRMEWLLTGEGEPFEKVLNTTSGFVLEYENTKINLPNNEHIELYTMPDSTMYPDFKQNDYVAIDKSQTQIKNGGVYLISVFGDCVLRNLSRTGKSKINISAMNKDLVPAFDLDESEIKVIGKYIYKVTIALN